MKDGDECSRRCTQGHMGAAVGQEADRVVPWPESLVITAVVQRCEKNPRVYLNIGTGTKKKSPFYHYLMFIWGSRLGWFGGLDSAREPPVDLKSVDLWFKVFSNLEILFFYHLYQGCQTHFSSWAASICVHTSLYDNYITLLLLLLLLFN